MLQSAASGCAWQRHLLSAHCATRQCAFDWAGLRTAVPAAVVLQRHPTADRPLIDYKTCALLVPCQARMPYTIEYTVQRMAKHETERAGGASRIICHADMGCTKSCGILHFSLILERRCSRCGRGGSVSSAAAGHSGG